MVPKFSHAFFLSTNLWLLAKHLLNFCQIHHFWQKFAFFRKSVIVKEAFIVLSFEFCSNFSCILPKFTIFAKIFYPRKNLFTNRPFFAIFFVNWIFWQAIHYLLPNVHQNCYFCKNRKQSTCLVCHFIWFLPNLMNCCQICHFCYNPHLSRCPFLSSLLSTF